MKFKKAVKKIAALSTGAVMVGATVFGAFAQADLAQYPNQYVKDGTFSGVLVVGDNAAAQDVIGVTDIATSLQFAATKPAGGAGGSTTTAEGGEAWRVGTSTKIMEMAENLETGTAPNREGIANVTSASFISSSELPTLLVAQTATNSKGDAPYEQRLYFENGDSGYVQLLEDRDDVTADFLYFPNAERIARYELEFTTALESDVDDSAGTATSTGTYLTDIEDTDLVMLDSEFTIVQARRVNSDGDDVKLILMGGAVKDTLNEGSTKTYTIDGTDYEVTLTFVDSDSAKFTVNGEGTRDMLDGDTDKLSDGTTIGVSEILYQDYAGGVHNTEFFLGAQKLELKDTDIRDTGSSNEVKVDDETIDGAELIIEGTDDNSTFKIDKITVNMTADDDYYVPAGGKLSENPELDEPELLFTKGWDIEYRGLSDVPVNEINIKSRGSDDYELEFVDGAGNKASIPIAHTPSGSTLKFGDNNDDLIVNENRTIGRDDYLIITDYSDKDGERQSFALRYRGADKSTADNPVLKFDDLGSGERIERPISVLSTTNPAGAGDIVIAELSQIKLGGGTFRVYNASSHTTNDFDVYVDLDGGGSITEKIVGLNTQYGANISIINASDSLNTSLVTVTDNGILVKIDTPNSDDYDDLDPTVMEFNITASSGEVRLGLATDQLHNFLTPDDDDKNTYAYTAYGAYVRRSVPTSDPQEVFVEYPQTQRVPDVWITGKGVSFSSTPTTTTGAVTVQRIDVGATKLASEVADINAVNSILVGGPCANPAAADVMGNPADCTAGFEPGVGMIKMYDVGDGNVAMLVAGYAAEDTRNAATVVANYQDHSATLKGDEVEVRKVNNVVTVAAPAAMVEEGSDNTEDTTA